MSVSKIRHQNIAELVGYCSEQGHNMLIYDYFRNGSLHEFLHLSDCFSKPLTWNTRVRIALGSARAIEYVLELKNGKLAKIKRKRYLVSLVYDHTIVCFVVDIYTKHVHRL